MGENPKKYQIAPKYYKYSRKKFIKLPQNIISIPGKISSNCPKIL
jgi:hypothetical protein